MNETARINKLLLDLMLKDQRIRALEQRLAELEARS